MKKVLAIAAVLTITAAVFAQPVMRFDGPARGSRGQFGGPYAAAELAAIKTELGAKNFGELSIDQLQPYWARMETALSKDRYLRSATLLSLGMPGAGQFKNGDSLAGAGFLSLHLGLVAGTLTGFYFLLPADLHFDRLDYLRSPIISLADAWRSHSVVDYLPAMGAMVAGALVDTGVRLWSAHAAYDGAKASIDAGTAHLEPAFGPGFLGMGLRF